MGSRMDRAVHDGAVRCRRRVVEADVGDHQSVGVVVASGLAGPGVGEDGAAAKASRMEIGTGQSISTDEVATPCIRTLRGTLGGCLCNVC